MPSYRMKAFALSALLFLPVASHAQQPSTTGVPLGEVPAPAPESSLKETLRWMQNSLPSGDLFISAKDGGEQWATRLLEFSGCQVRFTYTKTDLKTKKVSHDSEQFFNLGDIDPDSITSNAIPHLYSVVNIETRNDEEKITLHYKGLDIPENNMLLEFKLAYGVKFVKAMRHAVNLCGGLPVQSAAGRKEIPAIAKAANGAIVTIITAANDKPVAQGTGFLVGADGVIVTNYHVIETGNVAIVKFPDDTTFPVDGVLAADKVRDLAVIKIHGKTFRTLTLGNSDRVQVGEEVVAIGNPLSLESTVSNGIISGVRISKEQGGKFLQTTAPISPGSSGGPLFNMAGEVVGINTMYLEGGENLNFAIPVNDAKRLLLNQSTTLQSLPNEVEKESVKEEQIASKDNRWYSDLFGGEFQIKTEKGLIRIVTIRPPSEGVLRVYHISPANFSHDIILDVTADGIDLGGPLDARMECKKNGKAMVGKLATLQLHAASDSKFVGSFGAIDGQCSVTSTPITFSPK